MRARDEDAIRAALAPDEADGRLARLGKLAALSLMATDRPVTRSTMAAESKVVDEDAARARRGFSEASFRTNGALRSVYETARHHVPAAPVRRRGRVAAHILRMRKLEIAGALAIARLATVEREEEHALALARLGEPRRSDAIDLLREERAALPANRTGRAAGAAATAKADAAAGNAAAIARARKWAAGRSIRPTATWLAERCGLHPGTVERLAALAAADAATAVVLGHDLALPPALLRHRRWDLARALHVERAYIRALHAETMAVATTVIDREHLLLRAAGATPA